MDLYIDPIRFSKTAASETTLPEDANVWSQELLQELYKQVPYIADYSPTVVMQTVDGERGYGLGHFEIQNKSEAPEDISPQQEEAIGLRHVRIPIVINARKLQPLDIVITENSDMLPLTEDRLRQALFRPQTFDVTSRTPGDQSMIGQLYPPYRQNFGYGGGMGTIVGGEKVSAAVAAERDFEGKLRSIAGYTDKEIARSHSATRPKNTVTLGAQGGEKRANVGAGNTKPVADAALKLKIKDVIPQQVKKEGSTVLDRILSTIRAEDYNKLASVLNDPAVSAMYIQNKAATAGALRKLANAHVVDQHERLHKFASVAVKPQVCQLRRTTSGYQVKTASTVAWAPMTRELDRKAAINMFGEKVVLAADVSGSVTLSEGPQVVGPSLAEEDAAANRYKPITTSGLYKVQTPEGRELVGFVIPNLIDMSGATIGLALFTNGAQWTVQGTIYGEPAGAGVNLPRRSPEGTGCFYRILPSGSIEAIVPMTLMGKIQESSGVRFMGSTFDGQEANVLTQMGIKKPIASDKVLLLPEEFQWTPLDDGGHVTLQSDRELLLKTSMAHRELLKVTVRANGGVYSFEGPPLAKLAHRDRDVSFLSLDDAMFLLAGLGVESNYGATKLAEAEHLARPIQIRVGRIIKTAEQSWADAKKTAQHISSLIPNLKRELFKEAGVMPDPESVDTVLALGFINEENVLSLAADLPQLEDTQKRLCKLLFAARLGLSNVPVGALEKSIRALEQVIDGLKILAFTSENAPPPEPQQQYQQSV